MHYLSTRSKNNNLSNSLDSNNLYTYSQAMKIGLAMDGGLFIPEKIPSFSFNANFNNINEFLKAKNNAEFASYLLKPYFSNDPLESKLTEICEKALNFETPLKEKSITSQKKINILELFHGPTHAFKDIGARFLSECINQLNSQSVEKPKKQTVLVATSGDTGSAVAAAFDNKPNIDVVILFPKGMVSPRQEKLLSIWSKNVKSVRVRGTFDDCQRMVKEALSNLKLKEKHQFISANSINIGRLLPQMTYYAKSSFDYFQKNHKNVSFIIPSGNLGNATAAVQAKKMGFPIDKIVLSVNANSTIVNFFNTGIYKPQATIATLANAMDVGAPSNMERLLYYYNSDAIPITESSSSHILKNMKNDLEVIQVSDSEISNTIKNGLSEWEEIWCPHTATAVFAFEKLKIKFPDHNWVIVSTAHPAKFETLVENIIKKPVPIPESMQVLLARQAKTLEIDARLEDLENILLTT